MQFLRAQVVGKLNVLTLVILFLCFSAPGFAQEEHEEAQIARDVAEKTMATYGESIFKVRIVNIKSGDTSAYGTGFFVGDGTLLATNYHVASLVVLKPEDYKAIIDVDDEEVELRIVAVDVVHDLAILHLDQTFPALQLNLHPPSKGVKLYSIGNPHSLGMTVVEGNYNGLIEHRFLDKIHFSGALNSGMSGGPALNAKGQVVGVNVATSGNQIGFLVPVMKLANLLEKAKKVIATTHEQDGILSVKYPGKDDVKKDMGLQIGAATGNMLAQLMAEEWTTEEVGDAVVIGKMHENMECWGNSDEDEKKHSSYIRKGCNNSISIFVDSRFEVGYIEYESWVLQADDWPVSAFYRRLNSMFHDFHFGNRATKDDVENSKCTSEVVNRPPDLLKRNIVYCARAYKEYEGLYDTFYVAMSLDKDNTALFEHFTISGVNKTDAKAFLQRFIQQAGWQ
ncbi:Putative serine protease HhoA [Thalassocella blandensis]|nr:Putative serine protease HhoA [Thalassocella blandensis]